MKRAQKAIRSQQVFLGGFAVALVFLQLVGASHVFADVKHAKAFPIEMTVDFGPSGKPFHRETLYVEKGTTPKEAVSQVFPVLSGKACCSFREVLEIGGVRIDPVKNWWWKVSVNGSTKISPHETKLKKGDKVEWTYLEESQ